MTGAVAEQGARDTGQGWRSLAEVLLVSWALDDGDKERAFQGQRTVCSKALQCWWVRVEGVGRDLDKKLSGRSGPQTHTEETGFVLLKCLQQEWHGVI